MASVGEDRRWVIEQWNRLFGRNPSRDELNTQVDRLRVNGQTRAEWVQRVEQNNARRLVERAYDQAGFEVGRHRLQTQIHAVKSGNISYSDLQQRIADSPRALLQDPDKAPELRRDSDAFQYLKGLLKTYGLGSLSGWAWDQLQEGRSAERIIQDLRDTDEYKTRFKGLAIRRRQGLGAISEAEYIAYEGQVRQMMRAAGMPKGFYDDPDDFAEFIGKDVSAAEMQSRIMDGYAAAQAAPREVRAALKRYYNIGDGEIAAFFLDPDRASTVIQRQWQTAQVGAAAWQSGYGKVGRDLAGEIGALGVGADEAREGFAQLAASEELFTGLPGERAGSISTGTQVDALFGGNADAQAKIERRAKSRVTQGSGGAGFGLTGGGVAGLGGDR